MQVNEAAKKNDQIEDGNVAREVNDERNETGNPWQPTVEDDGEDEEHVQEQLEQAQELETANEQLEDIRQELERVIQTQHNNILLLLDMIHSNQ